VVLIKPKVFEDDRGFFMETYKVSDFAKAGVFPRHASAEASLTSVRDGAS
jgi:dTDP-4-dehydrorhamnose 3,5-epimerase-like enzyme